MDESLGFDDDKRIAPVEKSGKCEHDQSSPARCAARLGLALLIKGELLSEEQILGNEGGTVAEEKAKKGDQELQYRWRKRGSDCLATLALLEFSLKVCEADPHPRFARHVARQEGPAVSPLCYAIS